MKKRLLIATIALTAIAQPASAEKAWFIRQSGGQITYFRVTDNDTGISHTHAFDFIGDRNLETWFEDGNLKILHLKGDPMLYTIDKTTGTLTSQNINTASGDFFPLKPQETSLSDSNGKNIIRKDASGAIHIGENSLVTIEEGGRQKMYATNAAGESIDIDITNGSRLLINGRDVEKSIDNVGALSAALGSVPAISADSPFTCGFGVGTHSYAYAISGGCASKVTERLSLNAALATVVNNHTGDSEDNLSARAGFAFKLGKIDDSPKVAARKAAELHDKVTKLEESNQALAASNQDLIKLLQAQSARLENLEKIASGQLSPLGERASSD